MENKLEREDEQSLDPISSMLKTGNKESGKRSRENK